MNHYLLVPTALAKSQLRLILAVLYDACILPPVHAVPLMVENPDAIVNHQCYRYEPVSGL